MRQLLIIGIGAGDPDFVTVGAVKAMNRADVIFLPDKGEAKAGLNAVRQLMLGRFVDKPRYRLVNFDIPERRKAATPEYRQSVDDWRTGVEAEMARALETALGPDETGAFLVFGEPALYDGTIRILKDMQANGGGFSLEIIPGISAPQALAARHGIALNRVGETVTITTGRRVSEGEADGLTSFVVMLDNREAFQRFIGKSAEIFWGAYLGTPDEILIAGPLDAVAGDIAERRRAAQAEHGWIMDTYLIRLPESA